MKFRELVEELLSKYSDDFLDGLVGRIMLVVEEEEKRVVGLRAGECYQKRAEEINSMKELSAEERLEKHREAFTECLEEARRSILKEKIDGLQASFFLELLARTRQLCYHTAPLSSQVASPYPSP